MAELFKYMPLLQFILLIMGLILFVVLVFLLIWNVMKKRPVKALLAFFLLPVIMVAYPTIQSIKIGGIVIEKIKNVETATAAVAASPENPAAVGQLNAAIAQLKATGRTEDNSNALLAIGTAQMALGNYNKAADYLTKAERVAPGAQKIDATSKILAKKIKEREDFSKTIYLLDNQMNQLLKTPDDTVSLNVIAHTLSHLKTPDYVDSNEVVTLAKSLAIVGRQQQSLAVINKLDKTSVPNSQISALKDSIQQRTFQQQFSSPRATNRLRLSPSLNHEKILKNTAIKK